MRVSKRSGVREQLLDRERDRGLLHPLPLFGPTRAVAVDVAVCVRVYSCVLSQFLIVICRITHVTTRHIESRAAPNCNRQGHTTKGWRGVTVLVFGLVGVKKRPLLGTLTTPLLTTHDIDS